MASTKYWVFLTFRESTSVSWIFVYTFLGFDSGPV